MKQTKTPLSIGYTQPGEGQFSFVDIVRRNREDIGEVYFAFPGVASGRSPLGGETGFTDFDAVNYLVEDLTQVAQMGVKLHLLFNAACNGDDALSIAHQNQVYSIMDYLDSKGLYPQGVTTTSPVTAQILRREDPELELRASVNMRIGSIKGIQYVEHLFDSFCVSKDVNRDPETLQAIADYLHSNGKKLSVLVNSGCLRNCSMQSFHDNAVAHEAGIRTKANIEWAKIAGCREYFSHPENYTAFLQNTWIRPEDIHNLDGIADIIKLATRMHALPTVVVDAYAKRRYHGNLADLFEPGHGPLFAPWVIDNDAFPEDWYQQTTACNKDCTHCNYCEKTRKQVFILPEM